MGTTEHYDSTSAESIYTTKTNTFFVSANLQATPKVGLFLEGVYTLAEGGYAAWGDVTPTDVPVEAPISPDNPASTANYDFSSVNQYSDLDYTQLDLTFGLNYQLDKAAKVYGSVNLMDLQDDQTYVYGGLTGSIVTYAAGMSVGF